METTTATACQIDLLPFQLATVTANCGQMQQGGESDTSRFLVTLEKILQANGKQLSTVQAEAISQVVSGIIESTPLNVPSMDIAAVFQKGVKAGQGAEAVKNRIAAVLQQIGQATKGQTDQKGMNEAFPELVGMIGHQKMGSESIREADNFFLAPDKKDDAEKTIDQAIILSLPEVLRQIVIATQDNGAKNPAEEKPAVEIADGQDEPCETIGAEIPCMWVAETDRSGVLSRPENNDGEDVADSGNASMESSQTKEEVPQPTANAETSSQLLTEAAQPAAGPAIFPPAAGSDQSANVPEELERTRGVGQERPIQAEARHIGAADEARNRNMYHAAKDTTNEIAFKSSPIETTAAHIVPDNPQGEAHNATQRTDTVYSRLNLSDGQEGQQAAPNVEQTMSKESKVTITKPVDKMDSLLSPLEHEVVKTEISSKSQSFAKGEGDSNQLGQSFASQRSAERQATNSTETSSFGDIVADRIARTVEHIAETNRSDLTLRLKIDGSESVFLEMKERAGTILIGIQCQDKALGRALENQKETIVRTLETKNLNTSISVTTVGEDEQNRQRNGQRERHEQRRDNWDGRQNKCRSYFETLI